MCRLCINFLTSRVARERQHYLLTWSYSIDRSKKITNDLTCTVIFNCICLIDF